MDGDNSKGKVRQSVLSACVKRTHMDRELQAGELCHSSGNKMVAEERSTQGTRLLQLTPLTMISQPFFPW